MKYLTLILLLLATPACAQPATLVAFVGDSITGQNTSDHTDYATLTMAHHPGVPWCTNGTSGRTSAVGLTKIDFLMAFCAAGVGIPVSDVVIQYALNDAKVVGADPKDTALNLRAIAAHVVANGARPHILTPTPALASIFFPPGVDPNVYTREVTQWLYLLNDIGPVYEIDDMRDQFTTLCDAHPSVTDWYSCSSDGNHPTGLLCRQTMGDYEAGRIP